MGEARPRTLILDAGALIALERGDGRMRALMRAAIEERRRMVIPAGVLAQFFRVGPRRAVLRALLGSPAFDVPALDRMLAEAAGVLCGRSRTSDVIAATVVLHARCERSLVLTSDADDLVRLDPGLEIERV
jgi:hypothetical protein